ncbi:restriction endonuclease subunit S [Campylobacter upsaliensis]|uniref:restriction endonuclease subunit S n=1 Tax=Campylobacter upsaliensis TaxID=28080 RepID=UPI00214A219F|nr:restriction endonuclease subunit S [Campylobacter upsaliensis]MCR2108060.1 restriction endonuclease subunit S [Campylobacter upsaliensis]
MKTDTLKKSLLDYAIKGSLTAKFRRENAGLNAFNELEIYNEAIKEKRKNLEKELKKCEKEFKLEKDKEQKALFKSQIQMLKKELTKCKEITPLNSTEAPFTIPNSWAWVKLGDICEIFTGDSINTTEKEKNFTHQTSGLNYIATKDLANDTSITYENGIKIPDEFLPSFKIAKANSTLLCIEGGSAGRKVGFLKENVCFGNKLCCFENIFAFSKFVFYFLQSGEFSKEFNSNINGIIGGVKKESIRHFLIPLPPLCEQQEIVKKLDLLVTLANDFAITKENLKRIEKRIEKSLLKLALEGSLSKLYRRSSPTLCAFNEISTYNEAIKEKHKNLKKELKKCEKEFKLEKDKDKKAFFKSQIQMLKKELTKCKEITPLNSTEAPFTIPNSWAWVKLGDICEIISGEIIDLQEENLPLLDVKYLRSKGDKKLANSGNFANVNDRLILMDGENSGEIFITKEKGFLGSTLKKLEFSSLSQVEFMDFMLLCYKDFFKGNKKGAAIPHLDRKLFANLLIPLPPLKEQNEITQILDTLFTLKKGLRVD